MTLFQLDDEDRPPILGTTPPRRRRIWRNERLQTWAAILVVVSVAATLFGGTERGRSHLQDAKSRVNSFRSSDPLKPASSQIISTSSQQELKHVLVSARDPSPDLCKLVLTAATLSYPHPHLITWQETFDNPDLTDGGAGLGNISYTRKYLDQQGSSNDDDLVLLVDGYTTWFQLPPEVLVKRYHSIISISDTHLSARYGSRAMREVMARDLSDSLASKIVFGVGKHCTPNQAHTIACYALPSSPLPLDLYADNTDTPVGQNSYSSHRAKYLDSGYVIGPVSAMRKLFQDADAMIIAYKALWSTVSTGVHPPTDPMDNGSGRSRYMYDGNVQAFFAKIFGRQEYMREVTRRRLDPSAGGKSDKHKGSEIESTIINDRLNLAFRHEDWYEDKNWQRRERWVEPVERLDPWKLPLKELLDTYDYGITLDYFSLLGHGTRDSEHDATWLTHGSPDTVEEQIELQSPRGPFDCPTSRSMSNALGNDILRARHPTHAAQDLNISVDENTVQSPWRATPLYTHLCLSSIPALVQHNGLEILRNTTWPHMSWMHEFARPILQDASASTTPPGYHSDENDHAFGGDGRENLGVGSQQPGFGDAWTSRGGVIGWRDLCPAKLLEEGRVFGAEAG